MTESKPEQITKTQLQFRGYRVWTEGGERIGKLFADFVTSHLREQMSLPWGDIEPYEVDHENLARIANLNGQIATQFYEIQYLRKACSLPTGQMEELQTANENIEKWRKQHDKDLELICSLRQQVTNLAAGTDGCHDRMKVDQHTIDTQRKEIAELKKKIEYVRNIVV